MLTHTHTHPHTHTHTPVCEFNVHRYFCVNVTSEMCLGKKKRKPPPTPKKPSCKHSSGVSRAQTPPLMRRKRGLVTIRHPANYAVIGHFTCQMATSLGRAGCCIVTRPLFLDPREGLGSGHETKQWCVVFVYLWIFCQLVCIVGAGLFPFFLPLPLLPSSLPHLPYFHSLPFSLPPSL